MFQSASHSVVAPLRHQRSAELFARGQLVFPDGTTRATVERDPDPIYAARGEGAWLIDVDGNRYIDLNNNFTTLIHGHGFPPVCEAVSRLVKDGTCFANPTAHELALADLIVERIPAVEQLRFVNSGTEAVMFALKAARAATGKSGIARIEGAFHGAYDWAEIGQSSAPADWGERDAPVATLAATATPMSVADDVTVLRLNDIQSAKRRLEAVADKLGCILIDPMPSRAGLIAPHRAFIEVLQRFAHKHGILIVSDEVLNLRQGYAGASAQCGITPDLVVMGKIIGGGFPIGAIGGRQEVMEVFRSDRSYPRLPQGGTFSANPVSMVAGLAAMQAMDAKAFTQLNALGARLREGLDAAIKRHDAPYSVTGAASLFRIHPSSRAPREYREAYLGPDRAEQMRKMSRYFRENAIILPVGAAACISTPMNADDVAHIVAVFDEYLKTTTCDEEEGK